jgi:hypothetical protein
MVERANRLARGAATHLNALPWHGRRLADPPEAQKPVFLNRCCSSYPAIHRGGQVVECSHGRGRHHAHDDSSGRRGDSATGMSLAARMARATAERPPIQSTGPRASTNVRRSPSRSTPRRSSGHDKPPNVISWHIGGIRHSGDDARFRQSANHASEECQHRNAHVGTEPTVRSLVNYVAWPRAKRAKRAKCASGTGLSRAS